MIFNVLNKRNDKKCKNHLSKHNSLVALCERKQVQNTGGSVELVNGNWFAEGSVRGDFSLLISKFEIKNNYCSYCVAMAFNYERSSRLTVD